MNSSETNIAHGTAGTSRTPRKLPRKMTEAMLLDREEMWARRGLRTCLSDLGQDILDVVDIPRHVRRRPFTSLLVGALGGTFVSRALSASLRGNRAASALLFAVFKPLTKLLKASAFGAALARL